ncbi:MAG: DUF3857 domain-containing transglutaminase family protein [Acidobacteriota bacterium]
MRGRGLALVLVSLAALAVAPPSPAAEAPDWLRAAMRSEHPDTGAALRMMLLEEERMEVSGGKVHSRIREAVRLLKARGREGLTLQAPLPIRSKFKLVGAWKVRPDGKVTRYEKKTLMQIDADRRYEFSMAKVNVFRPEEIRVGDVIAWEYEETYKPEAFQTDWFFGRFSSPTVRSRFGLKVPPGWSHRVLLRNLDQLEPERDDDGYLVWEMWNQPALDVEELGVPARERRPALFVSYGPGGGKKDARQFTNWDEVSKWYGKIFWPRVVADQSIRRAVEELTTGTDSALDAIRALTTFTQDVRYLNVARGRSRAEPHPAPMILKNRFGDCEDHAVLTIAMLREIGVEAYPVQVRTSDLGAVPEEFPTPIPFNHLVVAVRPPADADLPAAIDAGELGSLVVFDPTDPSSGFGDLPPYLQGMPAVISSQSRDQLVILPKLPPEDSTRESLLRIRFAGDGGVQAEATATHTGQYGAGLRRYYRTVRGAKRSEKLSASLGAAYGDVRVESFHLDGVESSAEPIVLKAALRMPWPGKDLGSLRTMMPRFLFTSKARRLPGGKRRGPVRIQAGYREADKTSITIPQGWKVVEPLPAQEIHAEVGDYSLSNSLEDGRLILDRELTVRASTLPASRYEEVRRFFDAVAKADAASIAFEKRPAD